MNTRPSESKPDTTAMIGKRALIWCPSSGSVLWITLHSLAISDGVEGKTSPGVILTGRWPISDQAFPMSDEEKLALRILRGEQETAELLTLAQEILARHGGDPGLFVSRQRLLATLRAVIDHATLDRWNGTASLPLTIWNQVRDVWTLATAK